jgi:hypothetical protein
MRNILIIYNGQSMFTPTVQDYLDAFRRYSNNNVHFLHVYADTHLSFSLDDYDVVALTYACRLCYLENMSPHVRVAIANFRGLKVAFPQDEYQETNKLRDGIRELGIKLVFTCVPEDKIEWVYPPALLPGIRFRRVLTGYVPQRLGSISRSKLPATAARPKLIGYRGRHIGHFFGDLSYFKIEIGRRFKDACALRSVPHDIAWSEEARIYHDRWYDFILSCRATLGTPSGSNIFDWDGSLEREYRAYIAKHPDVSYQQYRPRIAHKELEIDMGQVSPRIFEAAALGTVLILHEGRYSGVVTPDHDCIFVKKDFSNINNVIDQLSDSAHISAIAERAYQNIIASGKWNYEGFVAIVDAEIEEVLDTTGQLQAGMEAMNFKCLKAAEQTLLEELSLKSPYQYPLAQWMDLSASRNQQARHHKLSEALVNEAIIALQSGGMANPPETPVVLMNPGQMTAERKTRSRFLSRIKASIPVWIKQSIRDLIGKMT